MPQSVSEKNRVVGLLVFLASKHPVGILLLLTTEHSPPTFAAYKLCLWLVPVHSFVLCWVFA